MSGDRMRDELKVRATGALFYMGKEYRSKGRSWVKLWVAEWLDGTTRYEMTGAQRAFWIDLVTMAGRSRVPGVVCAGNDAGKLFGYPLLRYEGVLNDSSVDVLETLKTFERNGKVQLIVTREEEPRLYAVRILSWETYQSEYMRQRKTRKGAAIVTPANTTRCAIEGEGEVEVEGEREEEKKHHAQASPSLVLPSWVPLTEWNDYKEMRKKIHRPMTAKAEKLAVSALTRLRVAGHDAKTVLEQSILNSWQGLFPIRAASEAVKPTEARPEMNEARLRAAGLLK